MISSCEKESQNPKYEIPTTYQFENVSYSGQTDRLGMLFELQAEIKKAATDNKKLSQEQLIAMYTNDSHKAGWQGMYSDSKQLKDKTFPAYQELFTAVLIDAADKSQNLQDALSSKFTDAKDVEWEKKADHYKVEFEINRMDHNIWYDGDGCFDPYKTRVFF